MRIPRSWLLPTLALTLFATTLFAGAARVAAQDCAVGQDVSMPGFQCTASGIMVSDFVVSPSRPWLISAVSAFSGSIKITLTPTPGSGVAGVFGTTFKITGELRQISLSGGVGDNNAGGSIWDCYSGDLTRFCGNFLANLGDGKLVTLPSGSSFAAFAFLECGTCAPTFTFGFSQGCHVERCGPGVTDNCVTLFSGFPLSQDGHFTTMNAKFTPSLGQTLKDAATACGFQGFDWQQIITKMPCPSPFNANPSAVGQQNICADGSLTAPPSYADPPFGGYIFPIPYQGYDPFPFYYPEALIINQGAVCSQQGCISPVSGNNTTLAFFDSPSNPCLPGANATLNSIWCGGKTAPAGSFMEFKTSLVGINQDFTASLPLFEWSWIDTYNLTSGGIPATISFVSADPGGIGGIAITGISGVPQTPPSVRCTATPNVLWPPNGKSVLINISGNAMAGTQPIVPKSTHFSVTDSDGQVQPSGTVTIASDGNYSLMVPLVASRDGNNKDGRQYTISVSVSDNIGNLGSCSAVVTVPHDQGH